jgi:integrase
LTYRGNSIIASFALPDGSIARRAVGVKDVTSENECTRRRLEFVRQVDSGTYAPWQKRQAVPKKVSYTVADLWRVYLLNYENGEGKNADRLGIAWKRLKPQFEHIDVNDVTTNSINVYIKSRRDAGVKNGTANRETSLLRAMFNVGVKQTPIMVDRLPAFPKRLKESPPRKGFIEDKDYAVLVANAKELWLRGLIAVAYTFGSRKGELISLRVRNIDFMARRIEFEGAVTKNGDPRQAIMTKEVYDLLVECTRGKNPNDLVFTRDGGQPIVDPREEWYDLCVSSKLGKFETKKREDGSEYRSYAGLNLHDFRRSAIRNMIRRGVNESVAMDISGHKTASVFKRYNITDDRDIAEATRLIEAGSQLPVFESKTDTKSDTVTFGHA